MKMGALCLTNVKKWWRQWGRAGQDFRSEAADRHTPCSAATQTDISKVVSESEKKMLQTDQSLVMNQLWLWTRHLQPSHKLSWDEKAEESCR